MKKSLLFSVLLLLITNALTAGEPVLKTGKDHVTYVLSSLKDKKIVIDETKMTSLQNHFGIVEADSSYMYSDRCFYGYKLSRSFSLYQDVLNSISYNSFYDDNNLKQAKIDSESLLTILKKQLGNETESVEENYYTWTNDKYSITYNIFEDGYSFNINSFIIDTTSYNEDDDCVGDFYGLKDDFHLNFLNSLKNDKIKIDESSINDISFLNGESSIEKDYNGISLVANFDFGEDKILHQVAYNYFYDCTSALSMLDLDITELTELINEELGIKDEKDPTLSNGTTQWNYKRMNLSLTTFSDGYTIVLMK